MSALPTRSPARQRTEGIGWFLAWIGDVQIVYMDGSVTDASYSEYLRTVAADIDGRSDEDLVSILYDVPEPSALRSERRIRLARLLKEREAKVRNCTRAYAMATPSYVVRGGMKMLFWLAPPPYPATTVATVKEGFEFIARRHPGIDPEAWTAEHALLREGHGKARR